MSLARDRCRSARLRSRARSSASPWAQGSRSVAFRGHVARSERRASPVWSSKPLSDAPPIPTSGSSSWNRLGSHSAVVGSSSPMRRPRRRQISAAEPDRLMDARTASSKPPDERRIERSARCLVGARGPRWSMTSHTVEARDDIERLAASRARPGRVPGSDPGGRPFNHGVDRAGWSLTRRSPTGVLVALAVPR